MLANEGREPFPAECSPDHPGFKGAEPATELKAVVHIVDFGARRVSSQVFWNESKYATKPLYFTDIENGEIERHEQHLVRVNHDRVRQVEVLGDPFALGQ